MFKELFQIVTEFLKNFFTSRLFVISVVVLSMMSALVIHLFRLQIVEGETYQSDYISQTLTSVAVDSSRGVIYDRNGTPLAYNKLAYSVTVKETGAYSNGYDRNLMLLELRDILVSHGEEVTPSVPMALDENGNYMFTTTSESRRLAFLRDAYGLKSIDELDNEEETRSDSTAQDVVDELVERYGIGAYGPDPEDGTYEVTKEEILDLIYIRYAMALNSYQRYLPSTVAQDVSMETVADVLEHSAELPGVEVEEDSIRVYEKGEYFANIIGYIGQADSEELEALQGDDGNYVTGDLIGKTGIEATMESWLRGTKGEQTMYVDSQGHILEIVSETEPTAGNDIYLTIDAEETEAIYRILEQQLAGILVTKIVNEDVTITPNTPASQMFIPVKDVYYQLIGNNVLSIAHFSEEDASAAEQGIYAKYLGRKQEVIRQLSAALMNENAVPIAQESEEMQSYISYAYNMLVNHNILVRSWIDTEDPMYQEWQEDTCSFREFLLHALTNGWIDTNELELEDRYSSTEETFASLVNRMEEILDTDSDFTKQIYRYMIDDETLTGRELCLALFDQGVLEYSEEDYQSLAQGSSVTAYYFIREKISDLEITPAQLALDPCSGSVVVTDVNTGQVLAMVSYPGYDNNLLMSSSDYYARVSSDESLPLYPRVTQTRTAPGSIFKMITAIAGMEEGVLQPGEVIQTKGIFTELGLNLRCQAYPGTHGTIGIPEALQRSCNYFFCEVGYRLSLDSSGTYSETLGLNNIRKYSEAFGLGEKSGVEVYENDPHVTDANPIPSAIGQGSHSYTNTQMNRYAVTLATRGEVLDLNLISHVDSPSGERLETYEKEVVNQLDYAQTSWDVVWQGMRNVITNGSYNALFADLPVTVAGKTGTAEESLVRAPHANFICFAPYETPEIAVSVSIPYGYTAANSVQVAQAVLKYHYGVTTLEDITGASASGGNMVDENEE